MELNLKSFSIPNISVLVVAVVVLFRRNANLKIRHVRLRTEREGRGSVLISLMEFFIFLLNASNFSKHANSAICNRFCSTKTLNGCTLANKDVIIHDTRKINMQIKGPIQ